MRKFLIAAHGSFSSGIKSSLDMIIGQAENIFVLDAYVHGNQSIETELKTVMDQVGPEDELVVFSDLMGGSVTNQILRHALRENVHIIAGMNLPLLIEMILADGEGPIGELIETTLNRSREQLVYVNKSIQK